jgi:signal transduction histidine kinase
VLVPVELNTMQTEAIKQAVRGGHALRTELRSRRKDGSTFWTGISLEPIRDAAGSVTHYVSIGADITTRLEEAQEKRSLQDRLFNEMQERERIAIELRFAQKLEAVGRLAAGIAHEINTPIQYIGDSVTFLQAGLSEFDTLLRAHRSACTSLLEGRPAAAVLSEINSAEAAADWPFLSLEMPKAVTRTLEGVARVATIVRAMKEFAHPDGGEQSPADLNHAIDRLSVAADGARGQALLWRTPHPRRADARQRRTGSRDEAARAHPAPRAGHADSDCAEVD